MMRNFILSAATCLLFMGTGIAQEKDELPQSARDFIAQNFSGTTITEIDKNDAWYNLDKSEMYEVELADGTELDFDRDGKLTEIESENKIPDEALPRGIVSYVTSNYPDAHITGWEMDDNEQEVQLSGGVELEFTREGEFIKED